MDYRKLNSWTEKYHKDIPFMDHLLNLSWYCFLDGYSGCNQITITPKHQERTTFTCIYGTFAFKQMSFGLFNSPSTFQRCMLSVYANMVEDLMEVFIDDFSVVGDTFEVCLEHLSQALQIRVEMNLVFNWEKFLFIVK